MHPCAFLIRSPCHKHIDNLKKENFSIKLRVHFLEERLAQLAPDQIDAALKQNINLKIEVQQRGMEMKKLKKLVLELEKELERGAGSRAREQELENALEERERDLRDLTRRRVEQGENDAVIKDLETRNADLEEQLENARDLLGDNMDELERLRDIVEKGTAEKVASQQDEGGEARKERMRRKMEALEAEADQLRTKVESTTELLAQKDEEKEDLMDEIDALRLQVEDIQRRRDAESIERSESRAQILEDREEREAMEDDLNALRDKLAAAMIELQQKEDDLDQKQREIDDLILEHQRIVEVVEEEWRGEVEEARGQVEELRDVLAERESESKDLRLNISELEANTDDLHAKFEAALAHLEQDAEEKDVEIQAANEAIEKLSEQIYVLEDENDRLKEESQRTRDDEAAERDRLEALSAALKEVRSSESLFISDRLTLTHPQKLLMLKSQLQEMTDAYEACTQEVHAHRRREEELAGHVEDLVEQLQRERKARERAEADHREAGKDHDLILRRERRALEAKDAALDSAQSELARMRSQLAQREADLEAVQSTLQTLEAESKKAGETHTTARFSLQLEADRLRRDLERLESDLARARKELGDRESRVREKDDAVDQLHAQNQSLAGQLAEQTQARLNATEKLDAVQASLRTAESEVATFRARVGELEQRLSKDQRTLLAAENQYRDQLTERNTLLLTIYQYMDKILGVDKTPVSVLFFFVLQSTLSYTYMRGTEKRRAGGDQAFHQLCRLPRQPDHPTQGAQPDPA